MVKYLIAIITAFAAFACPAQAFVVQSPATALSFNNFDRAAIASEPQKDAYVPAVDSRVDYEEIANKLLPEVTCPKLYIDLTTETTKGVSASVGQTFFVILPEEVGSSWHLDSKKQLAEIVSSAHIGNKRILELRMLCCGDGSAYLDNLIITAAQKKVVQSRILRLRVKR